MNGLATVGAVFDRAVLLESTPQPASVLDGGRLGRETVEFQDVLQPASRSRVARRSDVVQSSGILLDFRCL